MSAPLERVKQWSLALLGAAASSGILGCAEGNPPTSSSPQPGQSYLVFSPRAARRLAKPSDTGWTVSEVIGPRGGKLAVKEQLSAAVNDADLDIADDEGALLRVKLSIPKNALVEEVPITMSVHGGRLSELLIAFAPEGLTFLREARLDLKLDVGLADIPLDELQAYHQDADGNIEEAALLSASSSGDGLVHIAIAVPGFSTYGLRGSP